MEERRSAAGEGETTPGNANSGIVWWWACCSLFQSVLVAEFSLHASEPGDEEEIMEQDIHIHKYSLQDLWVEGFLWQSDCSQQAARASKHLWRTGDVLTQQTLSEPALLHFFALFGAFGETTSGVPSTASQETMEAQKELLEFEDVKFGVPHRQKDYSARNPAFSEE
ncbi:hypothetical protein DV515_00002713 [Chloebia gouldiae]|uniref:Uncharacterized protein n=1 Tax=Chloebia gouldiae TaxID=44316 RepID=A0A3L8SVI4_CHLGU|nr:hypothetical protein DV515_00002713 [Chloebia gouldiae]